MKNFAVVLISVLAMTGVNKANGQAQASADPETASSFNSLNDPLAGGGEINRRALKDFGHAFKNVTNEKWMKSTDGFAARFNVDGVANTVLYTNKGRWYGTVKGYQEGNLAKEIRNIVKSKYYDYSIFYVDEVETVDNVGLPTYIIHIEEKQNIKLLRISDGEMEVWKEYVKG